MLCDWISLLPCGNIVLDDLLDRSELRKSLQDSLRDSYPILYLHANSYAEQYCLENS